MYEWNMPLKYWGMLSSLSGPLGLGRAADTMVGGVPYKRGRHVGASKINVGISTISLGRPLYSSSPPSSTTSQGSSSSFLAGDTNQNKTPPNTSRHRTSAILTSVDDFEINGRRWDYRRLKPIDGGVTGFCTGVLFTP